MKLKLTCFLNRIPASYDFQADFSKAQAYHLKHGIDIVPTFEVIDIHGYVSQLGNTTGGVRYLINGVEKLVPVDPTADINMFAFDLAEWSNPPGSPFPLRPDTPTGDCYIFNGKPFVNIATYSVMHADGEVWTEIAHEVMHALRMMANIAGFPIQDVMDSYFHNDNPDYPGGNFYQQWTLLQPYLKSLQAPTSPVLPQVVITRQAPDSKETTGILSVNGFSCKTLELPDKNNEPNISCIPKGTYLCKYTFSPRMQKFTYEIQNVPNRSGIRIHVANYFTDLLGCIALGNSLVDLNHDGELDVANSTITINSFETLMGRKDFNLKIQ